MGAISEAVEPSPISRADGVSVQRVDRSILSFAHCLRRGSNLEVLALALAFGAARQLASGAGIEQLSQRAFHLAAEHDANRLLPERTQRLVGFAEVGRSD